jgi:hypothetical protein
MKQTTMFEEKPINYNKHSKVLSPATYKPRGPVVTYTEDSPFAVGCPVTIVHRGGATREVVFIGIERGRVMLDLGPLNGCVSASLRSGFVSGMQDPTQWQLERSAILAIRRLSREPRR